MPVALIRRLLELDVRDAAAARAFMMDRVKSDILLHGQPTPRVWLLADGHEEVLELPAFGDSDPEADPGATFQSLRERPGIDRRFVLVQLVPTEGELPEEAVHTATLLEEVDDHDAGCRRWWAATCEYAIDPNTGIGRVLGWRVLAEDVDSTAMLPAYLVTLAYPPLGSRPGQVLPPRLENPDIRVGMGELPAGVEPPAEARGVMDLALKMLGGDLLSGAIQGTAVLRFAGRAWEAWLLVGEMPTDLDDMVRYVANRRRPPADAVAVVLLALRDADDPPALGIQGFAEKAGAVVETWSPITFPEGRLGPKRAPMTYWRNPSDALEPRWLGVDPLVLFELGPLPGPR